MSKQHERRYHASWVRACGPSPLRKLGLWMVAHSAKLQAAPRELIVAATTDVAQRLPMIAAREPTRRHRKHFAWLLAWYLRLMLITEEAADVA